jgi:hypothetical protein
MNSSSTRVHFCTPDDALVARNILSFYIQIFSRFVKPPLFDILPSVSPIVIVIMYHLVPTPESFEIIGGVS